MKWTKDKPTVPGFYWRKKKNPGPPSDANRAYDDIFVVEVFMLNGVLAWSYQGRCSVAMARPVAWGEGVWAGPIPPPEDSTP